jgi:hypothetical protein
MKKLGQKICCCVRPEAISHSLFALFWNFTKWLSVDASDASKVLQQRDGVRRRSIERIVVLQPAAVAEERRTTLAHCILAKTIIIQHNLLPSKKIYVMATENCSWGRNCTHITYYTILYHTILWWGLWNGEISSPRGGKICARPRETTIVDRPISRISHCKHNCRHRQDKQHLHPIAQRFRCSPAAARSALLRSPVG